MKKIVALAGSNSSTSINKALVTYASGQLDDIEAKVLDLNDFEMPIYSSDREVASGFPQEAIDFIEEIRNADGIIISLAEYNGAYSGAFKNIFDWASRVEQKTFLGKPMLLMASSPGGRGGASVLDMALDRFPRHSANIVDSFSFPNFYENFKEGEIVNIDYKLELSKKLESFRKTVLS